MCPVFAIHHRLRRVSLVVPEYANIVATEHGELIPSGGIKEPRPEMLLFLERFNLGGNEFLVNPSFSSILFDVGKFVDCDGVLFVQCCSMKLLRRGNRLLWSRIFNKCKPIDKSEEVGHHQALFRTLQTSPAHSWA